MCKFKRFRILFLTVLQLQEVRFIHINTLPSKQIRMFLLISLA